MITRTHRLVLPIDTNHHGTLYGGSLLRIALEAAYATTLDFLGPSGNVLLRRVLGIECIRPVPVGSFVVIEGAVLDLGRAYLIVGLVGVPLREGEPPWMDGLFGFVPIDSANRPTSLPNGISFDPPEGPAWDILRTRLAAHPEHRGK